MLLTRGEEYLYLAASSVLPPPRESSSDSLSNSTLPMQRRKCMTALVKSFWHDDSGQGLAEYALLLGLIVVGVIVFIQGMGGHIKNLFGKANNELTTADQ
jgi:pilus assembly protein Flp/PilA